MQIDERERKNYCHGEALLLTLFFLSQHPNYLGPNRIIQDFWLEGIFNQPCTLGLTALARAMARLERNVV